jgi:hypothetical protein
MVLLNHCGENLQLSRDVVENINLSGGSFLGVSRGGAKTSEIVDSIQVSNLKCKTPYFRVAASILFTRSSYVCRPEELTCCL